MRRPRIGRRSLVAVVGIVAVGAVAAVGLGLLPSTSTAADGSSAPSASTAPHHTATVAKKTMTIEETLDGTIGYAGGREVIGNLAGTLTWLPDEGTVIRRGGRLYEVDGKDRAVLLYGSPARLADARRERVGRRRHPPARAEPQGARLHPQGRPHQPSLGRRHDPRREALAEGGWVCRVTAGSTSARSSS